MIRSNNVEDFLVSFVKEWRLKSRHDYAYFGVLVSRLHSLILYLGLSNSTHLHLNLRCAVNNT